MVKQQLCKAFVTSSFLTKNTLDLFKPLKNYRGATDVITEHKITTHDAACFIKRAVYIVLASSPMATGYLLALFRFVVNKLTQEQCGQPAFRPLLFPE